ncbi:PREDICTED: non-specific lipid transfer protein GPI-anchored 2-like [Nicotiana attenuata]|uniref:Non-specific lipid transfer protein gpi-anchored 2 n=1 Tax=Nicotiana attenuata TaxID=49451 RepID=A0A314KP36_NICAT|nr:PREDICTED: non-specific lipid transfer protein GPI-anchored 2-like [Nicotiana attenuata]OIT31073.1 non-specific lipid transfer protein gpi-anchored 2 [Nicotiana attenuata]
MKMLASANTIFVAIVFLSLHVRAQSDCQQVIVGLAPCLQYIQGNATTPSSGCCTQLATIVKNQPQCLCQVVNGGGSNLGINVNQTQAMALPKACNVRTPSVSLCKGTTPSASPGSPSTPSGGSKGEPSGNSSGNSVKMPYSLLFVLVAIASLATVFTTI